MLVMKRKIRVILSFVSCNFAFHRFPINLLPRLAPLKKYFVWKGSWVIEPSVTNRAGLGTHPGSKARVWKLGSH